MTLEVSCKVVPFLRPSITCIEEPAVRPLFGLLYQLAFRARPPIQCRHKNGHEGRSLPERVPALGRISKRILCGKHMARRMVTLVVMAFCRAQRSISGRDIGTPKISYPAAKYNMQSI